MADSKREIERKYEATAGTRLPDLSRVAGVSAVVHRGVTELDAVYHDTEDHRLAADSLTLRRRTGGSDAGWHLKFPVAPGIRDELREPLSDTLPRSLAALVRSRVRDAELVPVVRLSSARDVHHLLGDRGDLLAEVAVDEVRAVRLTGGEGTAAWTEIEVELADAGDPALLDAVEGRLRKAGIRPSTSASKLARALAGTGPGAEPGKGKPGKAAKTEPGKGKPGGKAREKKPASKPGGKIREKKPASKPDGKAREKKPAPATAGDHVLAYVRRQAEAIVALDPAVRRDLPDSVHQLRVATRRLRSALRTYRRILDRDVTDPLGRELKWLAAELGIDRDQEVLDARLGARLDELPRTLLLGPVRGRLRIRSAARRADSRRRTVAVLDGKRYLALLESLDALLANPPLLPAASSAPGRALPRALLKEYGRLAKRVGRALDLPPGHDRDLALHEARKAAKRTRYAAEAARPALGKPAKRFAKRMKAVQSLLGDHQDSVVAREALRTLAAQAHAAGESAFTWGLLYGREEAAAAAGERELPGVWARASRPGLRSALGD
ncbi:CHAD domain-containing protein [Streptomyces sp. ML-6]|uniref:CYTH and CHAD domain-containing protein n=1 Tax=Streptomyces sp. ML-6 TaxID=2982693 RepID=UPI0024C0BFA3|nr:CHAD domain-containing protein [Streptomyces sp. ML-6]MDK0519434.1 CHAD domain-containing protein [Streptomyces sp. ML-6]